MASLTKPRSEEFSSEEIAELIAEAGSEDAILTLVDDGETHTYSATPAKAAPAVEAPVVETEHEPEAN